MSRQAKSEQVRPGFLDVAWRRLRLPGLAAASSAIGQSPTVTEAVGALAVAAGSRIRALGTTALVLCQLVLVLLVINLFQLENRTFFHIMVLATTGFVVHALLPLQYRLHFFTLLSLASIMVALGLVDGASLVILGLVLIGICHLPVRLAVRVGLLLGVGALFALWRMELLPAPWSVAIWPLLASMFMFRLALYLVRATARSETAHASTDAGIFLHVAQRLLSAVPGHRLLDVHPHLLRPRRRADLPDGYAMDRAGACSI